MKKLSIYRHLPRHQSQQPSAVTIGNFDGVHRGHQTILRLLRERAQEHDLVPTVMTFSPHPRAYFARQAQRPELYPAQVNTLRDRLTLLHQNGIEQIVLLRFNHKLAATEAYEFVANLLVQGLNTRWLLVGRDFRFGHRRSGTIELLMEMGEQFGFEVHTIEDVVDRNQQRISSTDIRTALSMGDLDGAKRQLGHPFRVSGHVIHGRKLGRQIDYPTLNLRVPNTFALRSGVYAVQVHGLEDHPIAGVASLGVRPTVEDQGRLLLEVHLFNRNIDAYGKLVCVDFLQFIRDEEKFPDIESLRAAIVDDVRSAHDYFTSHGL
ncbi:MAG TPA: bifunctional riboflavin kinase/FAD synthetase [Paenalcaligenes sp.]|nr:bifunctional riboflavin kinase/FAD synthetase [Paenalcaligenes sp.]